jgi:signal transduction histidine kinase/ActR/RegA family two-component response regulator
MNFAERKNAAMMRDGSEQVLLYGDSVSYEIRGVLEREGFEVFSSFSLSEMVAKIEHGASVLIISKEDPTEKSLNALAEVLKKQPAWSHIPILVVSPPGDSPNRYLTLGNVMVLERPIPNRTLVSCVKAALDERKRQLEVRNLLTELEDSRQKAVEANRAKNDFLANISHEIRTPLGAVLGFTELVMDSAVANREKQIYMLAVRRNSQLLSALIDDILDLSKVEAGRIETQKIEFSLGEMLSEVVSALEAKVAKKGLTLNIERQQPEIDNLISDPIRMKQILMNLIDNAIKFTSHGHVNVRITWEEIPNQPKERRMVVEIEDTGIGISAAHVKQLFKPFVQADASITRRYGGTGLGLVLSQRLSRLMGGDVRLKWSIPGGGSCFEMALIAGVVRVKKTATKVQDKTHKELPLKGTKILVVDDSLDNQMLISRILKLLGAEVDLANDGMEAIDRALAQTYDVILMDLQMPRLGGVEATRILRSKGYTRPIVALTAHGLKEDRQRCLSVGCTDYLTKPIQRTHLVQVLERVAGNPTVMQ